MIMIMIMLMSIWLHLVHRFDVSLQFDSRSRRLKKQKMFLPHPRVKVNIVGSLRDQEVACSASDRQGTNFESCVWRTVSSQSSHHPQKVLLAQFSLYVHKGGLKPDSFHFFLPCCMNELWDQKSRWGTLTSNLFRPYVITDFCFYSYEQL